MFCCAMLRFWYRWLLSIPLRVITRALGQSYDFPSASEVTLKTMGISDHCLTTIKHNKTWTVYIFSGMCCVWQHTWPMLYIATSRHIKQTSNKGRSDHNKIVCMFNQTYYMIKFYANATIPTQFTEGQKLSLRCKCTRYPYIMEMSNGRPRLADNTDAAGTNIYLEP